MKTFLRFSILIAALSLQCVSGQVKKETKDLDKWLSGKAVKVRAFIYDTNGMFVEESRLLGKDGKLHPNVINGRGMIVLDEPLKALKKAIATPKNPNPAFLCHIPHHGFVFYDKDRKPIGHIDICFACSSIYSSPAGLAHNDWDLKAIKKIFRELDIPIFEKKEDQSKYTDLLIKSRKAKK